ncbi:MAG: TerB N-terminal domain-containing protein [Bacteroidetes bacterium]|nr:TerB N-terminal domain-containing protein [Bacteroidota bacterium]MCW5896719.1 TerB N-terminal domain-containing protein [Bacteroidota bacterium]
MEVALLIIFIIILVLAKLGSSTGSRKTRHTNTTSFSQPSKPLPQKQARTRQPVISWIRKDEEVIVSGYRIRGGLFYTGHAYENSSWSASIEPSMIDWDLPVHPPSVDVLPRDLGYWPSYNRIAPEDRAMYLAWLAGGRSDPSISIGYVFLFFYGLERRLLVDAKTSEQAKAEAPAIIAEVERLTELYGENSSFHSYASKFAEVCQYLYMPESTQIRPPEKAWTSGYPLSLKTALSEFAMDNKPIPPEWALSWLENSLEFYPRTPARRCRAEFIRLFQIRYRSEFGAGLIIKPNKTPLRFEYRPASSAFQAPVVLEAKDAPDITALKWPLIKLKEIAEKCTDELDAYSRYLGKNAEPTLSALGLLPAELLAGSQAPQLLRLRAWLASSLGNETLTVVEAKTLLEIFSLLNQAKFQKSDALTIAQLLAKLGYGLEPDPRFTSDPIETDGKCVLFKAEGVLPSAPTEAYKTASLIMRLCATVVSADGTVTPAEEQILERHIESVLDLSTPERERLSAYLQWLMRVSPDLTGLKKRLSTWSIPQRQSAVRLMLLVANADNRIDPAEVKILTRIYKLLELDPDTLFSDLHAAQTRPDELPATILQPDTESSGRSIPKPSVVSKSGRPSGVALSVEAIERTLRETHQVQQLLASVFVEEEVDRVSMPAPARTSAERKSVLGLDPTHSSLLTRLLMKSDWSRDDLESLCSEYHVLPDGAIETINTAAIEKHGDLLFDLSDSLQLNQDIAKEVHA